MKVLTVGMMVCDIPLSPVPKSIFQMEKAEIEAPVITTGGDALNVAITLAKLGVSTSIVGRLGQDQNGKFVMNQTRIQGVDTRYVIWDENCSTAVSYLLLDEDGEKHALSDTRIYHMLRGEDVPDEAIMQADIVYFGSAFQMCQMDNGGISQLFKRAHKYGKLTAMDTALGDDTADRETLLKKLTPVFAETDIFLPSYKEATHLSGCKTPEGIAAFFQTTGIKIFGVKLGADGCFVTDFKNQYRIPCFHDFKVIDTTGAGDSFVGGFLCGVLKNWELKKCARFASAVAAFNVGAKGATGGVPTYDTVIKFLKEREE